jgi:hypothetical protein
MNVEAKKAIRKILASTALLAGLAACTTTPTQCDMARPMGACTVRVQFEDNRVMVCSGEQPTPATPVCMSASLDVTTSKGYTSRRFLLLPGECRSLGPGVGSAAQASCDAYVMSTDGGSAGK